MKADGDAVILGFYPGLSRNSALAGKAMGLQGIDLIGEHEWAG